jgi:hypothetical protein
MDWDMVIGRQGGALRRILAAMVAMAGLGGQFTFFPVSGRFAEGEAQCPVDLAQAANARSHSGGRDALPQDQALAEKSKGLSPALTLPRHLHRAVLRLLRPAESAARRLVIVVARGMPLPVLPSPRRPLRAPVVLSGRVVTLRHLGLAGGCAPPPPRRLRPAFSLPLTDRLSVQNRRRSVPGRAVPRIWSPGMARPVPVPPPPSPGDPIDATRLMHRLRALGRALDDLPAQAVRLLRWKARRARAVAAGLRRRTSPLRPGRAPGSLRRPRHEVHDVLKDLHYFAWVAEQPDTS